MRVTINVPESLVERIDQYAEKHALSRSAAVSFAVSDFLDGRQLLEKVPELFEKMSAMSDMINSLSLAELQDKEKGVGGDEQ